MVKRSLQIQKVSINSSFAVNSISCLIIGPDKIRVYFNFEKLCYMTVVLSKSKFKGVNAR